VRRRASLRRSALPVAFSRVQRDGGMPPPSMAVVAGNTTHSHCILYSMSASASVLPPHSLRYRHTRAPSLSFRREVH